MFNYFQAYNSPAVRAQFDAQFMFAMDLSQKMLEGVQKINELNLQVVKALLNESLGTTRQLFASFNPTEPATVVEQEPLPVTEKIRSYQQHLKNILVETQADVAKTIESHVPETVRAAEVVVSEVVQIVSDEAVKAAELQKQAMENITTPTQ